MEVSNIYKLFIAEVKKQLSLKGWKYADLSKATGYTVGTMLIKSRYENESEKSARTTGRFKTKNSVGIVSNKWKMNTKSFSGTQMSFF